MRSLPFSLGLRRSSRHVLKKENPDPEPPGLDSSDLELTQMKEGGEHRRVEVKKEEGEGKANSRKKVECE